MQTALHTMALVAQMRRELIGGKIVATEFYKKERAAYFFVKADKTRLALGFVYHPHGYGVFVVPASKVRLETREKPWPIFDLDGAVIDSVEQIGLDRLFTIRFTGPAKDAPMRNMVVEALGVNGNLWLLDADQARRGTLRKREFRPGDPYEPPEPFAGVDPIGITADDIDALKNDNPDQSPVLLLQKHLLGFNRTLAIEAVERSGIDPGAPEDTDAEQIARTVRDMAGRFREPDTGYLHRIGGRVEVYPMKLSTAPEPPEKVKTLSLAVMQMCSMRQIQTGEADEKKIATQAVSRAIKRLERRLKKIDNDVAVAADFERYKKLGELLQINFGAIRKGMASITVDDAYSEAGEPVEISLDPALSPSGNVERYFKRHRKGREGLDLLKRRLEISRQELDGLAMLASELEDNFEAARERHRAELAALLPKEGARDESVPRLPFREYALSTGLTIFVGRDGADNDRTTFEFARPYETWLHTQQCPGSHVVIKYPNKSFEPSKAEVAEAAAIAAWFSKARNDTLVPVIYTERRYVRKPRKAKPGLVTVEREKSVMVAPTKPADGA